MRPSRVVAWIGSIALTAACGEQAPAGAALGGTVVARVDGRVDIPAELVARAAAEAHTSPQVALDRLVADAVAAEEARATAAAERPGPRTRTRAVLARLVLERIRTAARATPPTEAELDAVVAEVWVEVDRPELRRSAHALVRRPAKPDAATLARAADLAARVRAEVASAKDEEAFKRLAGGVHADGLEILVEDLAPMTRDGRSQSGAFDERYAAGLFDIGGPGRTSGVVETSFGFHVIWLAEVTPPKHVPRPELARAFAEEIFARRARDDLEAQTAALRGSTGVAVSPAAAAILESVRWTP